MLEILAIIAVITALLKCGSKAYEIRLYSGFNFWVSENKQAYFAFISVV